MTDRQKRTGAALAVGTVLLVAVLMIGFAALGVAGTLTGKAAAGTLFLTLAANFTGLGVVLKALGVVALSGLTFIGGSNIKGFAFSAIIAAMILGIISAILLLLLTSNPDFAADLWQPSEVIGIDSEKTLQDAVKPFLWWVGGGLALGLACFLGAGATGSK